MTRKAILIDGRRLNTARKTYHRIFKVDFGRVGRWYGPWWQNVPSYIRQGIHINGEPTSEPDIQALIWANPRFVTKSRLES